MKAKREIILTWSITDGWTKKIVMLCRNVIHMYISEVKK